MVFVNRKDKRRNGYIAILLCIAIPIILFGVKYTLDTITKSKIDIEKGGSELYKKCAKEAALMVAKNWNPGLSLSQQKDAVLKVADAIYNINPCYNDSIIGDSIPGLDIKKDHEISSNPVFNAMVVSPKTIVSTSKTVDYTTGIKYVNRLSAINQVGNYSLWNPSFIMWKLIDKGTDPENRVSIFDELDETELSKNNFILKHQDIYTNPKINTSLLTSSYPTNIYYNNSSCSSDIYYSPPSTVISYNFSYSGQNILSCTTSIFGFSRRSTYKKRVSANDTTVQVSIDSDKIKVQTDNDVGYAVPAECNIDIVLAIPTNGGASDMNNRDAASDTPGIPVSESNNNNNSASPNAIKTPLYQIGQACKNFVKDNFYHTRGVNVGLIPYSAKISISPDKISYVNDASTFVTSYFQMNPLTSKKMCGAALYNTRGEKYVDLSTPYVWGTELVGCPIMCRRGTISTLTTYGNNPIAYGDLLSIAPPTSVVSKFQRMNLNPCYMGYSNMLSLKCDKTCITYLPNPYYMIEPTADLVKIYELCNALYPIYDLYNVSNFIFIPVTWANNFFQNWTNNPSASATTNQISRPSKTTSGRKKALILIVNKPDWFEPGELTYVGFDNDYSEFPTWESDKIGFDIDYSDTSKRFLDGSNYNTDYTNTSGPYMYTNNTGLIAGPKKILKFSKYSGDEIVRRNGYYESDYSTCRLTFPQKGLLKLTVAPASNAQNGRVVGKVTFYKDNIGDTYDVRKDSTSGEPITLGSQITVAGTQKFVFSGGNMPSDGTNDRAISSSNGINFGHNLSIKKVKYFLENAVITNCYLNRQIIRSYNGNYGLDKPSIKPLIINNGILASRGTSSSNAYSTYWTAPTIKQNGNFTSDSEEGQHIARFMDSCFIMSSAPYWAIYSNGLNVRYIQNPNLYIKIYGIPDDYKFSNIQLAVNGHGTRTIQYLTSSNNYNSLSFSGYCCWKLSGILNYNSVAVDSVEFIISSNEIYQVYVLNKNKKFFISALKNVDPLTYDDLVKNKGIYLINYNGEDWICFQGDGELEVSVTAGCGLQFHNVSSNTSLHEIKETQTFYVEPSQISNTKDGDGNYYVEFTAGALKLISAEITNREYEKVTPTCYLQGSTNAIKTNGTAYIVTNVKEKMTIKAKAFPAEGTITFYNDNGIEDNVGTHKIINEQTFVFSGGQLPSGGYSTVTSSRGKNFGNNLSKYKVRYLSEDTKIVSATISSQLLRDYGSQYNRENRGYKQLILNNGMLAKNTQSDPRYTSPYTFGSSAISDPEKYISYFRDSCISLISYVAFSHESSAPEFKNGDVCWETYGVSGNIRTYFLHWFWYSYSNTANGLYTCSRNSNYQGNCLLQMYIKNDLEKTLIPECNIEKNEGIDLLYTNGLNSIPEGNYICFQGDGELRVTVKSTASSVGTIKYTKADVSGIGSHTVTTSDSYTTLTIDPTTHLYESNADGSFYIVRLDLNDITLDTTHGSNCGVAFASTPNQIYRFKKLDTSTNLARRGVNYTNPSISYDSSVISGTFSTFYNILRGNHSISSNATGKTISTITPRTLWGDITHITDDYGSYSAYMNVILGSDYNSDYYMPGCIRIFSPIIRGSTYKYLTCTEKSGTNSTIGGAADLIATEITYPINYVLYRGGYQQNINTTPTEAISKVTAAACQKLKADFGNNLRIYVIKYRKQLKYKSFPIQGISQTNVNHDYSTVDACASGTGTPYIYDISTETDLKNALNAIAENIKKADFANFKDAQNVN